MCVRVYVQCNLSIECEVVALRSGTILTIGKLTLCLLFVFGEIEVLRNCEPLFRTNRCSNNSFVISDTSSCLTAILFYPDILYPESDSHLVCFLPQKQEAWRICVFTETAM